MIHNIKISTEQAKILMEGLADFAEKYDIYALTIEQFIQYSTLVSKLEDITDGAKVTVN